MKKAFSNQKKLIKHLRKGNEIAYTYLVDSYYEKLCDYAKNLARDDFRAEDIVQNVFVRMWQKREQLNSNSSIKNHLYKSVYNEFIDQYRKDMATTALEKKYIEDLDSFTETEDEDNTKKAIHIVKKQIEQLPPRCKEIFLLSKKEGLTYIEIAEHLNISTKTVENQITKAYSLLRKKMKDKIKHFLFLLFGIK